MEINLNAYQKAIEILIKKGYNILQVFNQDGSAFYFIIHTFHETFTSSAQSVDFNCVEGINITDFMKNSASQVNMVELINKLEEYIADSTVIRCEFSKNVRWFKWGAIDR